MKLGPHTTRLPKRTERRSAGGTTGASAAFLSYSHAADGKLAPALQSGLHGFARPWFRLRALRVFRDEASLSANPGLWSSIVQALGSTQFFILLASPEAARSPWVGRETSYWVQHKSLATPFHRAYRRRAGLERRRRRLRLEPDDGAATIAARRFLRGAAPH